MSDSEQEPSARDYEPGPRLTILMLMECTEDYLKAKGHQSMRREVTEMRSELGDRLMKEVWR